MTRRLQIAAALFVALFAGYGQVPVSPRPNAVVSASKVTADFYPGDTNSTPSVDRLAPSICINGTCKTPMFRYKLGDCTASSCAAWTYGSTVSIAGTGTVPTVNTGSPLLGSNDDSATFIASGKTYQPASNTTYNVTTEDMVVEVVYKHSRTNSTVFGKLTSLDPHYELYIFNNALAFALGDAGHVHFQNITCAAASVEGAWYHALIFVDRSGNGQCYINGLSQGTFDVSTIGSLSGTNLFTLGGRDTDAAQTYLNPVAYVAMWTGASWLDSASQDVFAAERFASLTRTKLAISRGVAYPSSYARGAANYLRKYNGSTATALYLVGDKWPRVEKDSTTSGYLSEPVLTNMLIQSKDVATSWTESTAADTQSLNSVAFPDGSLTMDGNIANAVDGDHGFSQATANLTAATWAFSVFAKAGNKTWVYLSDDTVATATSYFDLTACAACTADGSTLCSAALGTKGAGAIARFAYNYGGGVCRVGISFTGTVAAHTLKMLTADADNDKTVTGNAATVNTSWGGMQAEAFGFPTSPIDTTTATVARGRDILHYDGNDNINRLNGSAICSIKYPNYTDAGRTTFNAYGSSGGNNVIRLDFTANLHAVIVQAAGTITANFNGTTDPSNGSAQTAAVSWKTDNVALYVAGVNEGTPDTSAAMPSLLTEIAIGTDGTGSSDGSQPAGLISRCLFTRDPLRVQ